MNLTFTKGRKFLVPGIREEVSLPPMYQQAQNFCGAVVRSTKSVVAGNPLKVTDATKEARQAICRSNKCGKYRGSDDRCGMCGCPISARGAITSKTELFAESCVFNFWRAGEMASGEPVST